MCCFCCLFHLQPLYRNYTTMPKTSGLKWYPKLFIWKIVTVYGLFFTFCECFCLNQFKISFFFQSRSKIFRKIHINNSCQWKYMNSFPNFNQIPILIKDIAFLCFTNFHCNFVSNPTYITQSVWMLYYIWFIDLNFILFSSICIRHTLKLDFNILFWWYFEISTFNCIWFFRIVFFSLSEFGWQVEAI